MASTHSDVAVDDPWGGSLVFIISSVEAFAVAKPRFRYRLRVVSLIEEHDSFSHVRRMR